MVDVTKPPMTAIAIGARNEAPSPKAIAIGNSERIVVKLVIKIGRTQSNMQNLHKTYALVVANCDHFLSW